VLVATTSSAAELLGVDANLGTLTPGKLADIVILAGDAFDLAHLKDNIRAVYSGGRLVRGQPGELAQRPLQNNSRKQKTAPTAPGIQPAHRVEDEDA
jgi:cytosine/adenosine deaminase-related metal-dependent hydrolase